MVIILYQVQADLMFRKLLIAIVIGPSEEHFLELKLLLYNYSLY